MQDVEGCVRGARMTGSSTHIKYLVVVLTAVVVMFTTSSAWMRHRLSAIDSAAVEIASDVAPSIEQLTAARSELVVLAFHIAAHQTGHSLDGRAFQESARAREAALHRAIAGYLALPVDEEERVLVDDLQAAVARLNDALEMLFSRLDASEGPEAFAAAGPQVLAALHGASGEIERLVEFNASRAHDLAVAIHGARARAAQHDLALDGLSAALALSAGWAAVRAVQREARREKQQRDTLAERTRDLEQFAGRVAHDILSPLTSVGLALQIADRPEVADKRSKLVQLGRRSLEQVQHTVDGLLDFARAGAPPPDGARAELAEVLEELTAETSAAATRAGVTLSIESPPAVAVACRPGVLTSLIGNLVHNAIKYIGEGPVRAVTVRASVRGDSVRVEVEDTGPGLPSAIKGSVFDPYVRGADIRRPGIGIGLATVRRMAEAHGGAVGVLSDESRGCVFWFELPKARGCHLASETRPAGPHDASPASHNC